MNNQSNPLKIAFVAKKAKKGKDDEFNRQVEEMTKVFLANEAKRKVKRKGK